MCPKLPASLFHTQDFPEKERYESFKDSIGVVFDVEGAEKAEHFEAKIKTYLLHELMLIETSVTAEQSFERSPQAIANDNLDHYLVQLFHRGYTVETKTKADIVCDVGKIIIIDTARPWEAFNGAFDNLTLTVPRRLIAPRLTDPDAHHGRLLDPKVSPFARVLYDYMISLQSAVRQVRADEAKSFLTPSLELLAAALNYSEGNRLKFDEAESSMNYSLRLRVKQFIEANLSNSNLSVDFIAAHCGLSRSYLYRLFPKSMGGVMTYARERRMNLAMRRLTTFSVGPDSIAQVAYATGFDSESSFTRAFKSYYGLTPTDAKKKVSRERQIEADLKQRGRIWERWYREL